jgi:hypothetical protein
LTSSMKDVVLASWHSLQSPDPPALREFCEGIFSRGSQVSCIVWSCTKTSSVFCCSWRVAHSCDGQFACSLFSLVEYISAQSHIFNRNQGGGVCWKLCWRKPCVLVSLGLPSAPIGKFDDRHSNITSCPPLRLQQHKLTEINPTPIEVRILKPADMQRLVQEFWRNNSAVDSPIRSPISNGPKGIKVRLLWRVHALHRCWDLKTIRRFSLAYLSQRYLHLCFRGHFH